jgi:hypothetical protein
LTQFAERYGYRQDGKIYLEIRLTPGELAGLMDCPRIDAQTALDSLHQRGLVDTQGMKMIITDLEGLRAITRE